MIQVLVLSELGLKVRIRPWEEQVLTPYRTSGINDLQATIGHRLHQDKGISWMIVQSTLFILALIVSIFEMYILPFLILTIGIGMEVSETTIAPSLSVQISSILIRV